MIRVFGAVLSPTIILVLLLSVPAAPLRAQQEREKRYDVAWLEYEAAEAALRDRDYSEALRRYARALEIQPSFVEAYVSIARAYRELGDLQLAERYYRRALEQRSQLQIPSEVYAIRLELAAMYDARRSGGNDFDRKYRNELLHIIADDPTFSKDEPPRQREAMRDVLLNDGVNRVIILYRLDFPAATAAHRLYGRYLLEGSDSSAGIQAAEHFLFALVEIAGRAVTALIDRRYDYEFTSLADLYRTAAAFPAVLEYLDREELLTTLRELRSALASVPGDSTATAVESVDREIRAIEALQ
ncbi:MAG: tetratricopeptide repeat protein [Alkalispirochaeta sp.]